MVFSVILMCCYWCNQCWLCIDKCIQPVKILLQQQRVQPPKLRHYDVMKMWILLLFWLILGFIAELHMYMQPMVTDRVTWFVSRSVCLSCLQKRLNQSWCHLGCGLGGPKKACVTSVCTLACCVVFVSAHCELHPAIQHYNTRQFSCIDSWEQFCLR